MTKQAAKLVAGHTGLDEVGSSGVPQNVRCQVGGQAGRFGHVVDDLLNSARGEGFASAATE